MKHPATLVIPATAAAALWLISCGGPVAERPILDIITAPEDSSIPPIDESDEPVDDTDSDPPVETEPPLPTYTCSTPTATTLDQACDFSVNAAVALQPTAAGEPLTLRTQQSSPNQPGAFNGPAVGNRAIAGFHDHHRLLVSDVEQFVLEIEKVSGSPAVGPEITLVVDLTCRVGPFKVATVTTANLGLPEQLAGNRQRYTIEATSPSFAVFDGLTDPTGVTVILPDPDYTNGVAYGPLSNLAGAYPEACLRNVSSGQDFLPRGAETSGVLLTLGRATNLIKNEWRVWRFKVNDVDHLPL